MKKDQDTSKVILISSNLLRNKIAVSCIVADSVKLISGPEYWSSDRIFLYLYYLRSKPPKILPARNTRLDKKKKTKC